MALFQTNRWKVIPRDLFAKFLLFAQPQAEHEATMSLGTAEADAVADVIYLDSSQLCLLSSSSFRSHPDAGAVLLCF